MRSLKRSEICNSQLAAQRDGRSLTRVARSQNRLTSKVRLVTISRNELIMQPAAATLIAVRIFAPSRAARCVQIPSQVQIKTLKSRTQQAAAAQDKSHGKTTTRQQGGGAAGADEGEARQ